MNALPVDPAAVSHVMSSYFATMERFLGVGQEWVWAATGTTANIGLTPLAFDQDSESPCESSGMAERSRRQPFLGTILSDGPDGELVARCTLDTDACPWLLDHTLGRDVSAHDRGLAAFPLVPFTLLAEIMAEAGSVLAPAELLIEMRDVRVSRWLALDRGPVHLEIRARRLGEHEIAVSLLHAEDTGVTSVAQATMVYGEAYPIAPVAESFSLSDARPYRWPGDRLYEEAMFHGPAFRGVLTMDRVAEDGALATMVVLDRSGLVASGNDRDLVTDFVLLDLPGQVVGFWAAEYMKEGFLLLPFQVRSLRLYGPMLPAGERLTCVARIRKIGEDRTRAALDVVRSDGRVWARFEDWEDLRFDVPPAAIQLLLKPEKASLSQSWEVARAVRGTAARSRHLAARLVEQLLRPLVARPGCLRAEPSRAGCMARAADAGAEQRMVARTHRRQGCDSRVRPPPVWLEPAASRHRAHARCRWAARG
jgi:hypothetical protein